MKIEIFYNGKYPCLCSGDLIVKIGESTYNFESSAMVSGGSVTFDEDYSENVTQGKWKISVWPVNFPKEYKKVTLDMINENIEHGCCGGCV